MPAARRSGWRSAAQSCTAGARGGTPGNVARWATGCAACRALLQATTCIRKAPQAVWLFASPLSPKELQAPIYPQLMLPVCLGHKRLGERSRCRRRCRRWWRWRPRSHLRRPLGTHASLAHVQEGCKWRRRMRPAGGPEHVQAKRPAALCMHRPGITMHVACVAAYKQSPRGPAATAALRPLSAAHAAGKRGNDQNASGDFTWAAQLRASAAAARGPAGLPGGGSLIEPRTKCVPYELCLLPALHLTPCDTDAV